MGSSARPTRPFAVQRRAHPADDGQRPPCQPMVLGVTKAAYTYLPTYIHTYIHTSPTACSPALLLATTTCFRPVLVTLSAAPRGKPQRFRLVPSSQPNLHARPSRVYWCTPSVLDAVRAPVCALVSVSQPHPHHDSYAPVYPLTTRRAPSNPMTAPWQGIG